MKLARLALATLALGFFGTTIARADALDTPLPAQVWAGTVGNLRVEKYGSGKPALILIPGLSCGAWSWHDAIAREAPKHAVYVVTLAGFDGMPVGKAPATLDDAESSLAVVIANEHLDRPVVIGHSLGGTLALRFGIDHGDLVRGIVSVDGLPIVPTLAALTPEQQAAAAQQFFTTVSTSPAVDYAKSQTQFIDDYVTDQTLAAKVVALSLRSDQQAVAEYGKELYALDLRPQLGKLTAPAAVIFPVPSPPLPSYLPAIMAQMTDAQRAAATLGFYQGLFAADASMKFFPVNASRHFVMLDQPAAFADALDTFVASLK